jgi:hypothetical protein
LFVYYTHQIIIWWTLVNTQWWLCIYVLYRSSLVHSTTTPLFSTFISNSCSIVADNESCCNFLYGDDEEKVNMQYMIILSINTSFTITFFLLLISTPYCLSVAFQQVVIPPFTVSFFLFSFFCMENYVCENEKWMKIGVNTKWVGFFCVAKRNIFLYLSY